MEFRSRKGTLNKVGGEVEKCDWLSLGAMHYVVGDDKKLACYYDDNRRGYAMAELCPEYIAYIKKLAEP